METQIGISLSTSPLSKKQRLFVESYYGDEVEAMQLAGYVGDPAYLRQKAKQLLQDPRVMEAIKDRSKYTKQTKRAIWTREERQEFWTHIAKNNDPYAKPPQDKFGNPLPKEMAPDIPMQQRLKATEMLGKSEGDFVDRVEMTTNLTLQQIIMDSYKDPQIEGDLDLDTIEAEYRKVRDQKRLEAGKDQIEDAEFTESEEDDEDENTGYSFI